MKRTISFALLIAALLVLGVTTAAFAQDDTPTPTCPNGGWVDADGDGVCDNAPQDGSGQQRGRQGGQGMSPGMNQPNGQGRQGGQAMGQGQGFEDVDGDGVCDHQGQGGQRQGRQGHGQGQGRGHGMSQQGGGMRGQQGGQGMGQGPRR